MPNDSAPVHPDSLTVDSLARTAEAVLANGQVDTVKAVAVVGGGPAGLQCARVAARRGHRRFCRMAPGSRLLSSL